VIGRSVLVALVAGLVPAQDDVVVHCVLPAPAVAAVREHLERRLGDVARVHVTRRPAVELVAELRRGGGALPLDVVFGLDACWLAQLAGEGVLAAHASPAAATLAPACRGGDRFVVPFVTPWRLLCDASFPPGQEPSVPADHDALLYGGAGRARFVVLEPRAWPSLFAGWMQRETRPRGERHALAWLRTFDAQVRAYVPDATAAHAAVQADRRSFLLAPACEAPADDRLRAHDVAPGLPWHGLGLALGGPARGAASAAARAVHDELAGEAIAARLAAFGLQPAPRAKPASAGAIAAGAPPADFEPNVPLERWLAAWEADVLGRGAYSTDLSFVLDVVFAAAFLGFLWFVWRRVRTEP
jgi:hypothetical protein